MKSNTKKRKQSTKKIMCNPIMRDLKKSAFGKQCRLCTLFFVLFCAGLVLLSSLSLSLLAGCAKSDKNRQKEWGSPEDIRKGKNGLLLSFNKEMPPVEVLPREQFNIGIIVKNDGATDIGTEPLYISISGYDSSFYDVTPSRISDFSTQRVSSQNNVVSITNLKGRAWMRSAGESDIAVFSVQPKEAITKTPVGGGGAELNLPPGEYFINFIATACYPYQTKYFGTICVDPQLNNPNRIGTPACTVKKELPLENGQGGPVAITRIEQDMVFPGGTPKALFRIYIGNVGGGSIVKRSTYSKDCIGSIANPVKKEELNIVKVSAKLSTGNTAEIISCYLPDTEKASNTVELQLGQDNNYVVCKANLAALQGRNSGSMNAYQTTLEITLDYGYVSDITSRTKVRKKQ